MAAGVALVSGCLPAGNVPMGRHLDNDRTTSGIRFAHSPDTDAPARLIVVPAGGDPSPLPALSVLTLPDVGPGAGAVEPRGLLDGVSHMLPDGSSFAPGPALTDGRLLVFGYVEVQTDYGTTWQTIYELFDPASGAVTDLGGATSALASPAGRRIVLQAPQFSGTRVRELDGRETSFAPDFSTTPTFAGEDVLLLSSVTGDLQRLRDGATTTETIATGVSSFTVFATSTGPLLVVCRVPDVTTFSCNGSTVDLDTLNETPFPATLEPGRVVSASPDGRFVLTQADGDNGTTTYVVVDRATGALDRIGSKDGFQVQPPEWRPDSNELWTLFRNYAGPQGSQSSAALIIWKPGMGTTEIDGPIIQDYFPMPPGFDLTGSAGSAGAAFTRDGRHYFSFLPTSEARGQMAVGAADDPGGAVISLNPVGTGPGRYWEVADGRLLVEAWTGDTDSLRNDLLLVDPDTGASRSLATGGHVAALGRTRVLALLDWVLSTGTGDLTLIDLDTGASTLIAENVGVFALQEDAAAAAASDDPLAPGVEIAFVVHNRLASPYDGVWIAALP